MSKWSFEQTVAPWLAKQKEDVMKETWGHLAPRKNSKHQGRIVFAVGCFGDDEHNPTPIFCEFEGLESSPWFFDALQEFLQNLEVESGCVYQFTGTIRNYEFKGEISLLLNSNIRNGRDCSQNRASDTIAPQVENAAVSL